jgi:hypothetical protein
MNPTEDHAHGPRRQPVAERHARVPDSQVASRNLDWNLGPSAIHLNLMYLQFRRLTESDSTLEKPLKLNQPGGFRQCAKGKLCPAECSEMQPSFLLVRL